MATSSAESTGRHGDGGTRADQEAAALSHSCASSSRLLQVERLPAVRLGHAAGHLPHVRLPQEAPPPTQEEEEEEKAEPGRPVERRRRPEGEEQQQEPGGHLLHGLWEGHQR